MPVIVIGADTALGSSVVRALGGRAGEVRAFVSDEGAAETLRAAGVKVAYGDVSDASHVGAAALNAFCAVLIAEAALDGRERSFAADAAGVISGWAQAISEAGVTRVIWVSNDPIPDVVAAAPREAAHVPVAGRRLEAVAQDVAALEAVHSL